jgi:MFS-type transporter involved in bile tolerance (Atg22 family)
MFALAGDFGCLTGPFLAGQAASLFGDDLRVGFIFSLIFPLIMLIAAIYLFIKTKKSKK